VVVQQGPVSDNNGGTNSYNAVQFRSAVVHPDPNSPSGKLFAEMAAVVGANNITPIPAGLLEDSDRELWLKSDSNALLYFWTRSPKVRIAVQKEIDKGCCYHGCTDGPGDCDSINCNKCCFPWCFLALPIFWPWIPCMVPSSRSMEFLIHQERPGEFNFGEKMYYKSEAEFKSYTDNEDDFACCSHPVKALKTEPFNKLYDNVFQSKLIDAGFQNVELNCCERGNWCFAWICSQQLLGRWNHIQYQYGKKRWGRPQVPTSYPDNVGGAALKNYRKDVLNDMSHPNSSVDYSSGTRVIRVKRGKRYVNKTIIVHKKGWFGTQEIVPNDRWTEQTPFSDLNLKELDYVIGAHAQKWSKVTGRVIDKSTLNIAHIFPNQSQ
jgi:hypothetical protein